MEPPLRRLALLVLGTMLQLSLLSPKLLFVGAQDCYLCKTDTDPEDDDRGTVCNNPSSPYQVSGFFTGYTCDDVSIDFPFYSYSCTGDGCQVQCNADPNTSGQSALFSCSYTPPPSPPAPSGPPAGCDEQGVCGDPHLKGAFGVNYDFHGVPDKDFNLISDTDMNLNAHFIGQKGEETGVDGTWLSALGVVWNEDCVARNLTVAIRSDGDASATQKPFTIMVDKKEVEAPLFHDETPSLLIHRDAGLTIRRSDDGRTHTIDILFHMVIKIAAAHHEHPDGNHIDITLQNLNVTATVHGALGQTYAESRRALLQEAVASLGTNTNERFAASDIVEGKDADYMTSSLLATNNKYNRYQKPCGAFTPFKQNVVGRKMLEVDDNPSKKVVAGAILCTSQADGLLVCSL